MKTETTDMNRRESLSTTAAVGGAMVLGFWLPPEDAQAQAAVTAANEWRVPISELVAKDSVMSSLKDFLNAIAR